MANEFKVRKGLVVNGSGSVILDVQGSQGQLFSVTDQLSGSLFSVNDISGVPVLEAFSDSTVKIGQYLSEAIIVSGSTARITGSIAMAGFSSGSVLFAGPGGSISQNNASFFWDNVNGRLGIGTNAPAFPIDAVGGNFRFGRPAGGVDFDITNSSTPRTLRINVGAGEPVIQTLGNYNLGFAVNFNRIMTLTPSNVLVGFTSDSGERLQVSGSSRFSGDMVITGSGATSATNALTIANSSGSSMVRAQNDGSTYFIKTTGYNTTTTDGAIVIEGTGYTAALGVTSDSYLRIKAPRVGFMSSASGTQAWILGSYIYSFNSTVGLRLGTAVETTTITNNNSIYVADSITITNVGHSYNMLRLTSTISSSVNPGLSRGLYISPTIIGNTEFRAIQWDNNISVTPSTSASWGLYGVGSAPNYLSGSLSIGSATNEGLSFQYSPDNTLGGSFASRIVSLASGVAYRDLFLVSRAVLFQQQGYINSLYISPNGNTVLNSLTDDGVNKLQVSGSAKITQALTASSAIISGSGTQRLTVVGSGSAQPLFTVQGSQGELFSIVDSLSGSLFSVNDQSGLPIMEVFSDNTILMGNYLDPMLLTTTRTGSAAGINTLYTLPTSSYDAVYIDYTIRSGSNARAGNFMAMWSGTSVNFTDNSITEFGTTSGFIFGAHVSGSNMVVTGSSSTSGWTVKTIIKAI
jgi:hypothetical protein